MVHINTYYLGLKANLKTKDITHAECDKVSISSHLKQIDQARSGHAVKYREAIFFQSFLLPSPILIMLQNFLYLIPCPYIRFFSVLVDAVGDIRTLLLDGHQKVERAPVKSWFRQWKFRFMLIIFFFFQKGQCQQSVEKGVMFFNKSQ